MSPALVDAGDDERLARVRLRFMETDDEPDVAEAGARFSSGAATGRRTDETTFPENDGLL